MALTVEHFTERLTSSGVMSDDQLRESLAVLAADSAARTDAEALARELVKQKRLTRFQAEQIYAGKGKALTLGNYVILDKLGQGGMGMVLKAEHKRMGRLVALKVMSPAAVKSPDTVKRFHREVQAAAKLEHPHIVTAYDADEANGTHFLVMQFVDGTDLSVLVKKNGPLPVEQAIHCILQAARGLEYAHEQGVIHRDIKPANLLIDAKGTVKILDMGLARIEGSVGGSSEGAGLTSTGTIMGTVDYMSPEQAMDTKHADARSDIYSLGCSLYYLLTGRVVYDGDTMMKKLMAHQNAPVPLLGDEVRRVGRVIETHQESPSTIAGGSRGLDPPYEALEAVFRRMVAKRPEDRQQSMTEVIAELERCLSGGSPTVVYERRSDSVTAVSASGSGNDLQDFLRQISGGEPATATSARASGTVATPSSVDAETMISSAGDGGTDPRTDQTLTLEQAAQQFGEPRGVSPRTVRGLTHPGSPKRKLTWLFGSIAAAVVVVLAVVFAVRGKSGTLNLDIHDELIEVTVGDTGRKLKGKKLHALRVPLGEHVLHIQREDLAFKTDPVEVVKGEPASIKVERVGRRVRAMQGKTLLGFKEPRSSTSRASSEPPPKTPVAIKERAGKYEVVAPNYQAMVNSDGLLEKLEVAGTTLIDSTAFGGAGEGLGRIGLGGFVTAKQSDATLLFQQAGDYRLKYEFEAESFTVRAMVSEAAAKRDAVDMKDYFLFYEVVFSNAATKVRPLDGSGEFQLPANDLAKTARFVIAFKNGIELEVSSLPTEAFFNHQGDPYRWSHGYLALDTDNIFRFDIRKPAATSGAKPVLANASSDGNSRFGQASSLTPLTPYEILTSPDYEWSAAENLGPAVNTNQAEGFPALSADGLRVVYHSYSKERNGLCEAMRSSVAEPFSPGIPLGTEFGNELAAGGTALSGDGLTLVFGSNRPGGSGGYDLWQATRPTLASSFSKPVCLTVLNSSETDDYPLLSSDGLTIWFRSSRPNSPHGGRWTSRRSSLAAEFESPVPFVFPFAPDGRRYATVYGIALTPDERVLISAPSFGKADANDLFISVRPTPEAPFSAPTNFGLPINSADVDRHPTLAANGTILVFVSDRPGGIGSQDLWMTRRVPKATKLPTRNALEFDGRAEVKVEVPSLRLQRGGPLTLEAYFTPTVDWITKVNQLLGFQTNALFVSPQSQNWSLVWQHGDGTSNSCQGPPLIKGRRVHVAGVVVGGELRLFVDGKGTAPQPLKFDGQTGEEELSGLIVGSAFQGSIDNVRVSRTARYRADFVPTDRLNSDAETLAYFDFSEGSGTELKDSSGNDHHGKIVGAKWVKVAPVPLSRGLIAHWTFDGISGAAAPDSSGHNHHATVQGAITAPGKFHSALKFDGDDDAVSFPKLGTADDFTYSLWVKHDADVLEGKTIVALVANDGWSKPGDIHFEYTVGRRLMAAWYSDAGEQVMHPADFDWSSIAGQWAHLAVVYQADRRAFDFYVNGRHYPGDGIVRAAPRFELGPGRIGHWDPQDHPEKASRGFRGLIDDVRIYDRALPQNEIDALARAATSSTVTPPPAKAPFDEQQARANQEAWTDWLGPKLKQGNFFAEFDGRQGWQREGDFITTTNVISGQAVLPDNTRNGAIRLTYLLRDSKGIQINARDRKTDGMRELYMAEDTGKQLGIVRLRPGSPYHYLAKQEIPATIPKDAPRTLEFRVVGDTFTATLNGSLVAMAKDTAIPDGNFALVALKGVLVQKVEYQKLDEPASPPRP